MKRLVFTVTTDLNYDQRMQRICTALAESGYRVILIGRTKPNSPTIDLRPYHQIRLRCLFHKGALFYTEYNIRLLFLLLSMKFDAVCGVDLDTALPAKLSARLRNKPFIYDAHEYFTEIPELVDRLFIRKIWRRIEKTIITPNIKAYTVSKSLADIFYDVYSVPFEVIRNVALKEDFPQKEITKKNRIIYAGAVNTGRGLEELIQGMHSIPYDLLICGDGDLTDKLKQMVVDLRLEHKVHFSGYLPPEMLRQEILASKIGYLMLSFQGLSYYHSLANKFFDYIHAEIPQLCIDFPEYRTINNIYEVAVLCKLASEDIVHGINTLINDHQLYQRLSDNCKIAKEHLNWQEESKKMISYYREILKD